ncbi:MAG: phosphatase PAP2 family protein [Eubacteriales bacterium]|nr:phosphatase PAP2 family protein [Eubacteriales bacterium]
MTLTPAVLWLNTVFAAFDMNVTLFIHKLYEMGGGFFTPFFELVSLLGKGGIAMIMFAAAMLINKRPRRAGTAVLLGLLVGVIITNLCIKTTVARPRPYADESSIFYQLWITVGQNMESDYSFPSGHTTAAMAFATALFFTCNKRYSWTAFIFALLMGVARVYLCVHFPSDVIGGFIVGFVSGVIGTLIACKLPRKWYELEFFGKKGRA